MRSIFSTRKVLLGTAAALLLAGCNSNNQTAEETKDVSAQAETQTPSDVAGNTIMQKWTGPYDGVPAWDKIKVSDFPGAFQATMDKVKADVNAIRDNPEAPTFENFIEPMELAGNNASELFSIWGVHASNLSNEEVRKVQGECCLLYTSPSPRDLSTSRMPSSA